MRIETAPGFHPAHVHLVTATVEARSSRDPVTAGSPQEPWLLTTPPGACLQSDWPELGSHTRLLPAHGPGQGMVQHDTTTGRTPTRHHTQDYFELTLRSVWQSAAVRLIVPLRWTLLSTGRDAGFHSLWLSVCMKWHSCNCTGLSAKLKCISEVILDYSKHEIWMRMLIKSLFDRWKIHFDHWTHHDRFPWETFLPDWFSSSCFKWWRHQMETFSALLAICEGNSPVTGEFPAQRPVTRSVDIFLWSAHEWTVE